VELGPWAQRTPTEVIHLPIAKGVLSRLDFLLEFARSRKCEAAILDVPAGFKETQVSRARQSKRNYATPYRRDFYEQMNGLDIQLHRYAKSLMKLDCEFFVCLYNDGRRKKHQQQS
jgi:hypothetical protein